MERLVEGHCFQIDYSAKANSEAIVDPILTEQKVKRL